MEENEEDIVAAIDKDLRRRGSIVITFRRIWRELQGK